MQVHGPLENVAHHLCREHLCDGDLAADLGRVTVALVDLPGSAQHEEAELLDLCVRLGNGFLHQLLLGDGTSAAGTRERAFTHHVEGELGLADRAHRVVDPPSRKARLRYEEAVTDPAEERLGWHPHIVVADVRMVHAIRVLAHVHGGPHDLDAWGLLGSRNIDMRRCGSASGSVTASTTKNAACRAFDVKNLSPDSTHSAPSRVARQMNCVGSAPACGSVIENAENSSPSSSGRR